MKNRCELNKLKIANLQYQFRETRYRIDKLSQRPVRNELYGQSLGDAADTDITVQSYIDMESEDL